MLPEIGGEELLGFLDVSNVCPTGTYSPVCGQVQTEVG
jgi:hypothetical protein